MTQEPDPLERIEEKAKQAARQARVREHKVSSVESLWEEILEANGFREMIRALGRGGT